MPESHPIKRFYSQRMLYEIYMVYITLQEDWKWYMDISHITNIFSE